MLHFKSWRARPRNRAHGRTGDSPVKLQLEELDDRRVPSSSPLSLATNHELKDGSKVVLSNVESFAWASTTNMGFALLEGGTLDSFTSAAPTKVNATIGSNVESFGTSSDGTLYALVAGGLLEVSTNSGKTWAAIDNQAESFAVTSSDVLYDLEVGGQLQCSSSRGVTWTILDENTESMTATAGGTLYNLVMGGALESSTNSGTSWTALDSSAESFAVTTSGTLYDLDIGGTLRDLPSGGTWKTLDANTETFAATAGNTLYNLLSGGTLKDSTNTGSSWSTLDSSVQTFGLAPNGAIDVLDTGGSVRLLSYSGASWQTLDTQAQNMAVAANGTVVDLDTGGILQSQSNPGAAWNQLDNATQSFGLSGNGTVFDLDPDGQLWALTASAGWIWLDGDTQLFSVGANGTLFNLQSGGLLQYSNNLGNTWPTLDTDCQSYAAAPNGVLYDLGDSPLVLQYTTNLGTSWNAATTYGATVSMAVGDNGLLYVFMCDSVVYSTNEGGSWGGIDINVKSFALSQNGTVFTIGGSPEEFHSSSNLGSTFTNYDGNTQSFSLGANGTIYNLLTGGVLEYSSNTGSSWIELDPDSQEFAVTSNGTLYDLADSPEVLWITTNLGGYWAGVDGNTQTFSVGTNGTLYDLQTGGVLEYSTDCGNTWTTLDPDTQSYAVSSNGTLYDLADSPQALWSTTDLGGWWNWLDSDTQSFALAGNGTLYNMQTGGILQYSSNAGTTWTDLTNQATSFWVSCDGSVYYLGDIAGLLSGCMYSGTWQYQVDSFAVGANGTLYTLLIGGQLQYSTNDGETWTTLDTAAQSFAVSCNGTLYDFGGSAGTLRGTINLGASWQVLDGDTQSFAIGTDGILYNQLTGGLLEYSCTEGSSWTTLDTATQSFAVSGNGTVYDLADSSGMLYTTFDLGNIWYWYDNRTESFTVGPNGTLYKLLIGGTLEYSDDQGNSFTTLDADTQAFAVNGNGTLFNLAGSPQVFSYSLNLGGTWSPIDSNTQSFAIAADGQLDNLLAGGTLETPVNDIYANWTILDSDTQSLAIAGNDMMYNLLTSGKLIRENPYTFASKTLASNVSSFALESNSALVALEGGQLEYSANQGSSWNALDTVSQTTAAFAVSGEGVIFNLLTNGVLESTANFGTSWSTAPYSNIQSFAVTANGTIYILSGGQIVCSPDFGNTWNTVDSSVQAFAVSPNGTLFDLESDGTLLSWGGAENTIGGLVSSFSINSLEQLSETNWFATNLPDAGLATLAESDFARDGTLTANDFIGLLEAVASRGNVTSAEFAALQSLVANSTLLNIPGGVEELAANVIDGNPANSSYQGEPLGNLEVGSTPGQVLDLMQEWFYADSPAPIGTPAPASWFAANMPDAGLATLAAADDARDGSITRMDFIGLLEAVAARGPVTENELESLQNLLANSAVSIPAEVANLGNKVVNGDPANAFYQGEQLGNLAMGSSPLQVLDLMQKWFYGTDHPTTDSNSAIGLGFQYTPAGGTLFGSSGIPSGNDVAQGFDADCYFMSSLGQVADQSPTTIENMFTNNGDGTYTVEFYNNGTPDYVTVDDDVPTQSDGEFAYADNDQYGQTAYVASSTNVLWVALAEKAYAQLAEEGWSRADHGQYANAYDSIAYGSCVTVMEQLTGSTTGQYVQIAGDTAAQLAAAETTVMSALAQNDLICIGTPFTFSINNGLLPNGEQLDANHAYAVAGYNSQTGMFTLVNPYDNGSGTRTIQVDWDTLVQYFDSFEIVTPTPNMEVNSLL